MQETYYGLSGVWDSIREKEIQGVPVHHCKPSVYRREPEGADGFVRGRGDDCQQAQWALPDRGQGGGKVSFKQAVAGTEGGDYPAVRGTAWSGGNRKDCRQQYADCAEPDPVCLTTDEKGVGIGSLGANGAGKTTLMRMLCAVLESTSGEVLLDKKEVTAMEFLLHSASLAGTSGRRICPSRSRCWSACAAYRLL